MGPDQSTDLTTTNQPAGTTSIKDGIAYDVSGKPLGRANIPNDQPAPKDDSFFQQLGGKPVQPAESTAPKDDSFFQQLGGKPVQAIDQNAELEKQGFAVPGPQHNWLYNNIGAGLYNDAKRVKDALLANEGPGWFPYDIAQKFSPPPPIKEATDEEAIARLKARNASTAPDQVEIEKEHINRARHDAPFEERNAKAYSQGEQRLISPEAAMTVDERKAHPILYGALRAVGNLTTEDNAMLFMGSGGANELAELAKISPALAAPGISLGDAALRTVGSALTKLPRAISLYFAGGMAHGVWNSLPGVAQAKKDYDQAVAAGDREKADQILRTAQENTTESAVNAYFAYAAAHHGLTGNVDPITGKVAETVSDAKDIAAEQGLQAVDKTGAAIKTAAGAVGKVSDAVQGKASTPTDAIMRFLNVPEKKKPVMRKKVEDVINDLQAIHADNKETIEDPASFAAAIKDHNQEQEAAMQQASGVERFSSEPVVPDLQKRITDRLNDFFRETQGKYTASEVAEAKRQILERVLQSRNGQHLQDPNLFEAENVRQGLNDISQTAFDVGTGKFMPKNAHQAAAYEIANLMREVIDESYDNHGVENVKQYRQKEAKLIDVAKAMSDMQGKAEAMGQPGWFKALFSKATGLESALAIGTTLATHSIPGGAAVLAPAVIGNKIYQNFKNPIANVNRFGELANPDAKATEVNVRPSTPPSIDHKLYATLSSYYGKIVGTVPFEDLENMFTAEAQQAYERGSLTPEQSRKGFQQLLEKVNESKATQRAKLDEEQKQQQLEQQKAAEKQAAEDQKQAQKAQTDREKAVEEAEKKKQEQAAAGLITTQHPPFETTEHIPVPARFAEMGYTPQRVGAHELAHQIIVDLHGHGTGDIINHLHDQIDSGSLAEARWEKPEFQDEDGNFKTEKLPELLEILHAGVVAEELLHDVPLHENAADDLDIARRILKDAGLTPTEAGMMMKAAEMNVRNTLTQPGVLDIIKRYTEHREAGLDKDTHMSAETVGKAVQEVRHATGRGGKTGEGEGGINENDNKARPGEEGKTSDSTDEPGGESKATPAVKEEIRPAGETGAGPGKGGKTNLRVEDEDEDEEERNRTAWSPIGKQLEESGAPWEPIRPRPVWNEKTQSWENAKQGGHAGGGVASEEELSRPGRFVKISRSGMPTDQGKTPDFNLAAGEAGYQVKPDGTYELKAGQETPATKRGVEQYSKGVFNTNLKPKTAKETIEDEGLVHKGELVAGSNVHMFEHPEHPGKTAALQTPFTGEDVTNKMRSKLDEFGVNPNPVKTNLKPQTEETDTELENLAKEHGVRNVNQNAGFRAKGSLEQVKNFANAADKAGYKLWDYTDNGYDASILAKKRTIAEHADEFNRLNQRPLIDTKTTPHDPEFAKRVADAYDQMQHTPNDPKTQQAYQAMKNDVDKQWDYATNKMGVKFEPWNKQDQPYANSKEMVDDVRNNKHLYFFQGGDLPEGNPLAEVDPKTGLTYNDKFRAVHDLFGHAAQGNQFGPKGEEVAYQLHRQMFSPEAIPALTTETRGQNSWVNYGKHLRDEQGNVPAKGEQGFIPQTERPYAEQKTGLLPEEFHGTGPAQIKTNLKPGTLAEATQDAKEGLDRLAEHFGISSDASKAGEGASLITPEGKFIHLSGSDHPAAINIVAGYTPQEYSADNRVPFINESGAVRSNFTTGKAGPTLSFSVPKTGLNPKQIESMKQAVREGLPEYGQLRIETADNPTNLKNSIKDFATEQDVEPMLREIGALPQTASAALNRNVRGTVDQTVAGAEQQGAAANQAREQELNKFYTPGGALKLNLKPAAQTEQRPVGSTVKLLDNPLKVQGTGQGGEILATDVAKALANYTTKKLPALEQNTARPADIVARAKRLMEDEAKYQLSQNNAGAEWYTKDIAEHDQILQNEMRPELKDPAKLSMFKMAEAILSAGNNPINNFEAALLASDTYRETGEFPHKNPNTNQPWGRYGVKAYGDALQRLNDLIHDKGEAGASEWLLADHPVSELKQINPWVAGKPDEMQPGTMIFGPKRGPFALNLHGKEAAFTADQWVDRSWNRWMGTVKIGPDGLLNDKVSPVERRLMHQSFNETAQKLGITTSSLQAVMWYYEQALYDKHGVPTTPKSFSEAARAARDREFSTLKFKE
jgi:hypothetical protein